MMLLVLLVFELFTKEGFTGEAFFLLCLLVNLSVATFEG